MRAVCWHGKGDVHVERVPDPRLVDPRDAIVKVTSTAICGSDLHLYDGLMPTMQEGDILGHEFMGEVVEVASGRGPLRPGDRVVVPFCIACGSCFFCRKGLFALCDRSNPKAAAARKVLGHSPAGLFGYSHMLGGFAGGQAEYVRVPYADVGPIKIESNLTDEQVLFLSDVFPTGWMAAENCHMEAGSTVAVWGCGAVGQLAIRSAWMLGAGRVIAIDRVNERLEMAARYGRAETVNFERADVYEQLMEMTGGRGPDRCIDAVGAEAEPRSTAEAARQPPKSAGDRPHVLREAIKCCRKGGTLSVPGAYIGTLDNLPFGAAMSKGITITTGQTHVHRYLRPLLKRIEDGEIDPSFVVTHRLPLDDAPAAYRKFHDKADGCIKVVMTP